MKKTLASIFAMFDVLTSHYLSLLPQEFLFAIDCLTDIRARYNVQARFV